jgi:hypothetical protein
LMVAVVAICLELVARPFSSAQDRVETWIQRHNPSTWFWPDED